MATRIIPVESSDMVIFGASGDLAQRKILPGLYHRLVAGQLPPTARIIGAARSKWNREEFQKKATESYFEFVPEHEQNPEMFKTFLNCLHYVPIDAMGNGGWDELTALVNDNPNPVRAFYLSV
ncbi:MAG: glucose-6-phosphate dehydrogenase, partial [Paracoccaceae bacterium]